MQKRTLHVELDNNVYDMQCMSSVDTIPTVTAKGKVPLSSLGFGLPAVLVTRRLQHYTEYITSDGHAYIL